MSEEKNTTASERPLEQLAGQCKMATDCLPNAPYRKGLEGLHEEMLLRIESMSQKEQKTRDAIVRAFGQSPVCCDGVLIVSATYYNELANIVNTQR